MFMEKESNRLMQYFCIFLFTATFDDIETAQIYDLRNNLRIICLYKNVRTINSKYYNSFNRKKFISGLPKETVLKKIYF